MHRVQLTHRDPRVFATTRDVDLNKPILLGAGQGSDFVVSGEIDFVQTLIEYDGQAVRLRNLAPHAADVLVNDVPVWQAVLDDGDVVRVGNSEIVVHITASLGGESESARRGAPRFARRELPTGILAYEDADAQTTLDDVLSWLTTRFTPLLVANFLAAGQEPPPWLSADDDLLAAAPREQIGKNCLYLIAPDDTPADKDEPADDARRASAAVERLLALFHSLRGRGAAALLFGQGDKQQVLKAIGFRRGFYASATGLEMFLRQGSPQHARALMEGLHVVLVADAAQRWTAFANPATAGDAIQLNLSA